MSTSPTTTQAIDALVARRSAATQPLDRPLISGVQAQADAAVEGVPAERVALATLDINGKPILAGFANRVSGVVAKTSRKAA